MSEDETEKRTDATEARESIRASQTNRMLYRALPSEIVDSEDDGRVRVSGYCSTVNDPYEVYEFGDRFLESFAPGAFVDTFREDNIKLMFEHGHDALVGRRPMGRATKLEEDDYGARFEAYLYSESSYVADVVPAVRDGQYGTSIGFMVHPDDDDWNMHPERSDKNPKGIPERIIRKARLREFSLVSDPCNPKATAQVRSITERYVDMESRDTDETAEQEEVRADDEVCSACGHSASTADDCEGCDHIADRSEEDETDEAEEETDVPEIRDADTAEESTELTDVVEDDNQEATNTDEPAEAEADAATEKPDEPRSKTVAAEETSEVSENKRKVSYEETVKSRKKTKTNEGISNMENSKMTSAQRSARADEIQERLEELALEFDGEELPDERQAEWDGLMAERAEHAARIEADEKRREQLAEVARDSRRTESTRQAPAVHLNKDVHDYTAIENLERSNPDEAESRAYDNARRIIEKARFAQSTESREANQEHVERILESRAGGFDKLAASKWIMRSSEPTYRREYNKWVNSGGVYQSARADMAIGTDNLGGYMVPFDLDPTWVMTSDGAVNPLREVARVEKITGKEYQGVTTAGVTVTQDSEGAEVTEGNPVLGQIRINAVRFSAYLTYSYELEGGTSNLAAQLTSALAEAKAEDEASRFATATGDGLTGIEGLAELDDVAGSMIDVAVTGSLSSSDLYALDDDLAPRHRRNASFLAGKPTYNAIRQLDTAGGADLWVRLGGGLPGELIGYQAREMSDMESQGDSTTNAFLILGDWKKYYIVDRLGMVTKFNPLVVGTNGRPTGESAIVAWYWMGGKFADKNAFRGLKDDGA